MPVFARHEGHDMGGMDMGGMDMGGDGTTPSMSGMSSMKMYIHGSIGGDLLWFASWQPTGAGATVGACIGLFVLAILDRGKVGFSLPVASGALPSGASSATAIPALDSSVRRRDPAAAPTPTASEEKAALALNDASACACGCGGECGSGSSSARPCGGTGSCAPDYDAITQPKDASSPQVPGAPPGTEYLPRAVRASLDPSRPGRWSRPFRWGVDVPRGLLYTLLMIIHFLIMLVVMTYQLWWIISTIVGLGVGEALFGRFGAPIS